METETIYNQTVDNVSVLGQTGILITVFLILIPLVMATILIIQRAKSAIHKKDLENKLRQVQEQLRQMSPDAVEALKEREAELNFALKNTELGGTSAPLDKHGLVENPKEVTSYRFLGAIRQHFCNARLITIICRNILELSKTGNVIFLNFISSI